jgi:hypothetical protein
MVHESGQRYPASARGVKTNGATHPHVVETGDQCTAIHRDRQAGNEVPPGYRFADYERYWEVRFDIQTESHGAPTLDVDSRGVPSLGVFE